MKTVIVELKDDNALRLLKDLELANIIRLLDEVKDEPKKILTESLRCAITKERAKELNEQLHLMRNEWEKRDIFKCS